MTKLLIAAAPLALLGACSGGADQMQAGEWEMTTTMSELTAPDMPEAMQEQMQASLGEAQTRTECITEEEAANPLAQIMDGSAGDDCEFDNQTFEGGVINISGTCEVPGSAEATVSIEGTYTATEMNAEIAMDMTMGPMGQVTMSGTMAGERTGDCEA